MRHPHTTAVKTILKALPFRTWVRGTAEGTLWVGPDYAHDMTKSEMIANLLRWHGYTCELNGESGTSGRDIVDVAPPGVTVTYGVTLRDGGEITITGLHPRSALQTWVKAGGDVGTIKEIRLPDGRCVPDVVWMWRMYG